MRPISALTVVYDPECGLCSRARQWMLQQVRLVALNFVPSGSPDARRRFPRIPAGALAVVADTGEIWFDNHAWIVCLWALRDFRDLAFRLTTPGLSRLAVEAFELVSRNRRALSRMLRLRSDRELEQQLRRVLATHCQTEERWLE